MASTLPPINTLSLAHTGASPTTLVDGPNLFNPAKTTDLGTSDSLTTASDGSSLVLTGKPLEIARPEDATEVAGMHDRLRLKKHENLEASGAVANKAWMDLEREQLQAYEYLCHLGEAKEWIEAMIAEPIPSINQLDDAMQRGVILAKLAKSFCPSAVGKIFEKEGLQYRHTDNINYLFTAMRVVGLPELFIFELTDAYDKKNIPKVIYAIHALSHLLSKRGMGPKIRDLRGQLSFTEEELRAEKAKMDEAGLPMPNFGSVESSLAKEMKEEEKWNLRYSSKVDQISRIQAQWRGKVARRGLQAQLESYREQQRAEQLRQAEQLRKEQEQLERQLQEKERREAAERDAAERAKEEEARQKQHRARIALANALQRQREQAAGVIQAWFRKGKASELESMRTLSNPALSTVRKYLHLADSTNADFVEEAELEELKQQVIRAIRNNTASEAELKDLETKISLLIRNKVTLEEVVKTTSKQYRVKKPREGNAETDIFSMKALDKESRQKLEGYQSLFYLLQTQPQYLGKLMFLVHRKWNGAFNSFAEGVVMALFGYAQQAREEYMLLQLIKTSIGFEVKDAKEISDIAKAQPFSVRLLLHYTRAPGQRKYLQQTLGPLVKEILESKDLDLSTDVVAIYRSIIQEEETKSGQKSDRPFNVTAKEALAHPETRARYTAHLQSLQVLTARFLDRIIQSLDELPYGIRYIISELRRQLEAKFPNQKGEIESAMGHMLYYRYINPAICAPEAFEVVTQTVSDSQRKNLGEVGKMLNFIQNGAISAHETTVLPLVDFVQSSSAQFRNFLQAACEVMRPEDYFQIDEYQDLTAKPTIMIALNEINWVHQMLVDNFDDLVANRKEPLAVILQQLGAAPQGDVGNPSKPISITLTNRHVVHSAESRETSRIWAETKRLVADVLATNSARNLIDLLEATTTEQDEQRFRTWQQARLAEPRTSTTVDVRIAETLASIKRKALNNLSILETSKRCKRQNSYQDIVTAIAQDIMTKTKRRSQRQQELTRIRQTIVSLQEKSAYLADQKKSFNDYIDSCTKQLSNSKSKSPKKAPLFSKQYWHVRSLQKSGRMPTFGSYKYTAEELRAKGVLLGVEGYTPKHYGGMTLVISSNQPGVFLVDCTYLGVKLADQMELRIEDLLQQQNEGVREITLFEVAKVNVNLLLFLLNKRFFA